MGTQLEIMVLYTLLRCLSFTLGSSFQHPCLKILTLESTAIPLQETLFQTEENYGSWTKPSIREFCPGGLSLHHTSRKTFFCSYWSNEGGGWRSTGLTVTSYSEWPLATTCHATKCIKMTRCGLCLHSKHCCRKINLRLFLAGEIFLSQLFSLIFLFNPLNHVH